jgi:hypothetical protein
MGDTVTPRPFWWLAAGLTGYLGFRPAFNRAALTAGAGLAAGMWLVYEFFRLAGVTASKPSGKVSNVVFLLAVWQVLAFTATRLHADPFQDPPGPLLPYSARHRLVLWIAAVTLPIALALTPAYVGVLRGYPGLRAQTMALALLADAAVLTALTVGLDLVRWLFRTYALLGLRRLLALAVMAIGNVLFLAAGVLCFAVALQFGLRRVFVSQPVTNLMQYVARGSDTAAASHSIGAPVGPWQTFDTLSTFSTLVAEQRAPTAAGLLERAAALGAVLLLAALFPARRPEEPGPITRYALVVSEWSTELWLRACPAPLRLSCRLMLPALYRAVRAVSATGAVLVMVAFFLTWDRVSGAGQPAAIERMLAASGVTLAFLLSLVLVPVSDGVGLRAADYVRYATLPVSSRALVRRMVLLGLAATALLVFIVAVTWALVVQSDMRVALAFATTVAAGQAAALAAYVALIAVWWLAWQRVATVFSVSWIVLPAALLIAQFGLLRTHPEQLASAATIAVTAALLGVVAVLAAIGRMVAAREPAAGL